MLNLIYDGITDVTLEIHKIKNAVERHRKMNISDNAIMQNMNMSIIKIEKELAVLKEDIEELIHY